MLQADWNGNTIILKTPKALGQESAAVHVKDGGRNLKLTQKDFIEQVRYCCYFNYHCLLLPSEARL